MGEFDPSSIPGTNPWAIGALYTLGGAIVAALLKGTVYSKGNHAEWMTEKEKQLTAIKKELDEERADHTKDNDKSAAALDKMREDRDQWRLTNQRTADQLDFYLRQQYPNLPPPPKLPPQLPGGGP